MFRGSLLSFVLVGLALANAGCPSPSRGPGLVPVSPTAQTRFNHIVNEKTAFCEESIREKMVKKVIFLSEMAGIEDVVRVANMSVQQTKQVEFQFNRKNKEITSLDVRHFQKISESKNEIRYTLTRSNGQTRSILDLNVSINLTNKNSAEKITEDFQILKDCQIVLSQAKVEKTARKDSLNHIYSQIVYYADGGKDSQLKEFTTPEDAILENYSVSLDSVKTVPDEFFIFVPAMGLGTVKLREQSLKKLNQFGLSLELATKTFDYWFNNKVLTSVSLGEDEKNSVVFSEIGEQETWIVPLELWYKQALGDSKDINETVHLKISKDYLEKHDSLLVKTKAPFDYDHLSAYFHVEKTSVGVFRLTENKAGTIKGSVSSQDLISNDTIQVDLPKIQSIAKEIETKTNDRRTQIQLILNYLNENYVYDTEMVENNVVRPLTTEEALNRGKGVCQHYSVIFTSIARALKIPTRIIFGYSLRSGIRAIGHAWIETEIAPELWKVIEPQDPQSLLQLKTRYYIPIARASMLEDKKADSSPLIPYLFNVNYEIAPNQ